METVTDDNVLSLGNILPAWVHAFLYLKLYDFVGQTNLRWSIKKPMKIIQLLLARGSRQKLF
jgi:hypothetical protein